MNTIIPSAAVRRPNTRVASPSLDTRAGVRLPESPRVPRDRHARILAVLEEHQQDQRRAERDRVRQLLALRDEYRRAYEQLVGPDARRLLQRLGAQLSGREPGRRAVVSSPELRAYQRREKQRQRLAFRELVRELRLDTAAIARLRADFRIRFERVAYPDLRDRIPPAQLLHHQDDHAALPVVMAPRQPPYDGSDWWVTGWTEGAMSMQTSHDGTGPGEAGPFTDFSDGRVGSWVRLSDGDASDLDIGFVSCRSGMLLWYTPGITAPIVVSAALRCIRTGWGYRAEDEWGISDAVIGITANMALGVFAEGGYEPGRVYLHTAYYEGTPDSGSPSYFMTDVPITPPADGASAEPWSPGEVASSGVMTLPGVYPADQPVLIHVGVEHLAGMHLNDVSATASASGEWVVESVSVGQDSNQ